MHIHNVKFDSKVNAEIEEKGNRIVHEYCNTSQSQFGVYMMCNIYSGVYNLQNTRSRGGVGGGGMPAGEKTKSEEVKKKRMKKKGKGVKEKKRGENDYI